MRKARKKRVHWLQQQCQKQLCPKHRQRPILPWVLARWSCGSDRVIRKPISVLSIPGSRRRKLYIAISRAKLVNVFEDFNMLMDINTSFTLLLSNWSRHLTADHFSNLWFFSHSGQINAFYALYEFQKVVSSTCDVCTPTTLTYADSISATEHQVTTNWNTPAIAADCERIERVTNVHQLVNLQLHFLFQFKFHYCFNCVLFPRKSAKSVFTNSSPGRIEKMTFDPHSITWIRAGCAMSRRREAILLQKDIWIVQTAYEIV